MDYETFFSGTYGQVFMYDKTFDRVTPKNERPLQTLDRVRYNVTTSEDPVIQQVCLLYSTYRIPRFLLSDPFVQLVAKDKASVYITDTILSCIMCATRSVYPWDIVITHENGKLYFDKRDGGPLGQFLFRIQQYLCQYSRFG